MKTAFVLSGGGAKGAFQVGVLHALGKLGIRADVIYGTSVGAINAAGMAYDGIDQLMKEWLKVKRRSDTLSLNWWKLPWASGIYSTKPLRKKLMPYVTKPAMLEAVACMVDITTGGVHYVSNKKASIQEYLIAVEGSSAIPFFMDPVEGKWLDGGVREQTPLSQAIKDGADQIIAILCNPWTENPGDVWVPSWPKFVSVGVRALDIMEHEVFRNDIVDCLWCNSQKEFKKIDLQFYAPPRVLMDTLEFDGDKIRAAIEAGERAVLDGPISIQV